ncbi:MAG: hypothetical protein SWY16_13340 [Cyanobacteriota bacterium]|nr:hypothetical protein [Cyanobacteriota bacterium]
MNRLSDRAFTILSVHLDKSTGNDPASQVQRDIVKKRLRKLLAQSGDRLNASELRSHIDDIFPDFSDRVLQKAAKANRPPGLLSKLKWVALFGVGSAGFLMFVNLPYPMIRRPVAKTAPILLLPSFMSMDYHYRQAIARVEQADQLVNRATSQADFELGAQKVREAQTHLDRLPVWFLGYEPTAYCSLMGCSWRFTLDEFKAARANIGRMEAQIFQEKNGRSQLDAAVADLNEAKQQYELAQTQGEKSAAIAAWQASLDSFQQIPTETLAGRTAQTQLVAAERDFQPVAGIAEGVQNNSTAIEAAKIFALQAAQESQNPPHPAQKWKDIASSWQMAIDRLNKVEFEDPGYLEAQAKLAEYRGNLDTAQRRASEEETSVAALTRAKERISNWQSLAANNPQSPQLVGDLQSIVNELDKVQAGTTAYAEAEQLRAFARNKLASFSTNSD